VISVKPGVSHIRLRVFSKSLNRFSPHFTPVKSSDSLSSADQVNNTASVPMGFDVKRICLHADPVAGFRRLVSSHPEAPGVNSAIRLIAKPGKIARLTTRLGARQLNRRLHLAHQQKSCERRISTSPYCQKGSVATLQEWSDMLGQCSLRHRFSVYSSGGNLSRR
jgi:hypothetical protein